MSCTCLIVGKSGTEQRTRLQLRLTCGKRVPGRVSAAALMREVDMTGTTESMADVNLAAGTIGMVGTAVQHTGPVTGTKTTSTAQAGVTDMQGKKSTVVEAKVGSRTAMAIMAVDGPAMRIRMDTAGLLRALMLRHRMPGSNAVTAQQARTATALRSMVARLLSRLLRQRSSGNVSSKRIL